MLTLRSCDLLLRWRSEATAIFFPLVVVVLTMRHHLENKYFLAGIEDACNQSVVVPSNVEDDAIADDACRSKVSLHVTPRMPSHGRAVYVCVPGS